MKIFYDTEFIEDGITIGLLSIGMVAEDGRELYRIIDDEDTITRAVAHPWLRENVIPHLPVKILPVGGLAEGENWDFDDNHDDWHLVWSRATVADDVREFIQATPAAELWAYYGAYDHVALAQLFGRMIDLPEGCPMWTNDLMQLASAASVEAAASLPPQPTDAHNALTDALWVRDAYNALAGVSE